MDNEKEDLQLVLQELEREENDLVEEKLCLLDIERELQLKIEDEIEAKRRKIEELKNEVSELKRRCEELANLLNIPVRK
jgi:predicted RNase H-like nuclease (RuvC/YqgF family)